MSMAINRIFTQTSQISSILNRNADEKNALWTGSQSTESSDQVDISPMGRMMHRIASMMEGSDATDMKAKLELFNATYEESGIGQMDVSIMTEEEIQSTLAAFASAMGDASKIQGLSISQMSSADLKETLSRILEMGNALNLGSPIGYNRVHMGGAKPPNGLENAMKAFESAYDSLGLEDVDIEALTDEEIMTVLTQFEEMMGDYGLQVSKSASDMTSSELRETFTKVKTIGEEIKSGIRPQPPMGRPPMGGMKAQGSAGSSSTDESESTEEKTYIEALLEALEKAETEAEKVSILNTSFRDMYALINQLNFG